MFVGAWRVKNSTWKENGWRDEMERNLRIAVYALYFVDSFGYMQTTDVERLFSFIDKYLSPEIRIGFHAHNNMITSY